MTKSDNNVNLNSILIDIRNGLPGLPDTNVHYSLLHIPKLNSSQVVIQVASQSHQLQPFIKVNKRDRRKKIS